MKDWFFALLAGLLAVVPVKLCAAEGCADTDSQPRTIKVGYFCQAAAISPDGKLIAAGHPTTPTLVCDAETGQVVKKVGKRGRAVAFHPKDGTLYTGNDEGVITIYDPKTGDKKGTLGKATPNTTIHLLQFLPDGKTLLAATYKDVTLWDTGTSKDLEAFKDIKEIKGSCSSCSLTPDGKYLAVLPDNPVTRKPHSVRVIDVEKRKLVLTVSGLPEIALKTVALSPDGKRLVGAGLRYTLVGNFKDFKWGDGVVQFWDLDLSEKVSSSKLVETIKPDGLDPVQCAAFTPDGKAVLIGSDKRVSIRVYDSATRKELTSYTGGRSSVSQFTFSADGKMLLAATGGNSNDDAVLVWELAKFVSKPK